MLKDRQFSTVDDVQEALFTLVNDEKAGYVSFDEAREIRYQLTDMIFTAPDQSLNDQMPDSLLTAFKRNKLGEAKPYAANHPVC